MYERFTDRARKVMQLANQEAQRFNHAEISAAHILLGLVKEPSGVAGTVLRNLGADLGGVRAELMKTMKPGPEAIVMGKLPQDGSAKRVIEGAIEEARELGHNWVGTEHLLLGILRGQDYHAATALSNLGVSAEKVREEVLFLVREASATSPTSPLTEAFIRVAWQQAGHEFPAWAISQPLPTMEYMIGWVVRPTVVQHVWQAKVELEVQR